MRVQLAQIVQNSPVQSGRIAPMPFRLTPFLSLFSSISLFGLPFLPLCGLVDGHEFFPSGWAVSDDPILPEKTHLVKPACQTKGVYAIEDKTDLEALYQLILEFVDQRRQASKGNLLTNLTKISIGGPPDFAANHDLYASGVKGA